MGWDGDLKSASNHALHLLYWQSNVYLNLGNTYHIYEQTLKPIDMYTHLQSWIDILERELSRKLEPDDYLFPYISPIGVIHPKQAMTHEIVMQLLNEFSVGAGINKHFTTHSLRRGGAQYRFMYAPLGCRWALDRIRWWGGWAEGESVSLLNGRRL